MVYLIVGTILALWFAIAGVLSVFKPRLIHYVTTAPVIFLLLIGFFAAMIDEQLGYEHQYNVFLGLANGLGFYKFLIMENWALSIFVVGGAFLSYEIAKLISLRYISNRKPKPMTTSEYMHNFPSIGPPAQKGDLDLF